MVLAILQKVCQCHFDNENHYRLDFENENHYHLDLTYTQKNLYKRFRDYRKVYEVKGFLTYTILLKYRCVSFGMVLALILFKYKNVFHTVITHHKLLLS